MSATIIPFPRREDVCPPIPEEIKEQVNELARLIAARTRRKGGECSIEKAKAAVMRVWFEGRTSL